MVKIDQLSYFLETAKQEHLGRAARALGISPSAISHSIAALEDELGRSLFTRKGKNIFLTDHGKLLMERAQKLLNDVDTLKQEIASEDIELEGYYRIAASHLLCSQFLVPTWTKLQNVNPSLKAEIYTLRSAHVVEGVVSGEYDLGICFSPQPHPDLSFMHLYSGQLLIAVAKEHPILKKKLPDRLAPLSKYSATFPKAFQGIDVCEQHPVLDRFLPHRPAVNLLFDSYEVASENVANSNSWGFFPDWVIKVFKDRIQSVGRPEGWEAPYTISAIWRGKRPLNRTLGAFVQGLKDSVAKP